MDLKQFSAGVVTILYFCTDLREHPAAVSEGAVRVQIHADGSQLVQFLL